VTAIGVELPTEHDRSASKLRHGDGAVRNPNDRRDLRELGQGWVKPINELEEHFVAVTEGRASAVTCASSKASTRSFNLERAVGRPLGCVPRGAWQGTTRRNSYSIATSCNVARRRAGRAPGVVAAFTLRVSMPLAGSYHKISVLRSFSSGQLLFLGSIPSSACAPSNARTACSTSGAARRSKRCWSCWSAAVSWLWSAAPAAASLP